MKRKDYEKSLAQAPGRALPLAGLGESQRAKVIIVFEGRDAAGKGGTIKAMTERVSPRVFRVVALARAVGSRRRRSCTCSATSSSSRPPARS